MAGASPGTIRAAVFSAVAGVVLAAALFASAGDWRWPMAWAFLVFYVVYAIVGVLALHPDLIAERTRFQPDADPWDLVVSTTAFVLFMPVTLAVGGLDVRYGWSPPMPHALAWVAFAVFVAGYFFALWAARSNPFFSTVVRIQRERGHRVVAAGPYALVRHPGYAGAIVGHLALPIALGSLWALVPTVAGLALLVMRTAFEDRTLADGLPGYRDYTQRVRWRLFPYVW